MYQKYFLSCKQGYSIQHKQERNVLKVINLLTKYQGCVVSGLHSQEKQMNYTDNGATLIGCSSKDPTATTTAPEITLPTQSTPQRLLPVTSKNSLSFHHPGRS